ncbi:DUF2218 domain-containing protein [Halomonas sp. C05BenzN]|uniref:DUF2218 domain-containing protein n=1 Tax=Halomonas sp. C05BenzN TaxID=3411041 RepID=UPI003B932F46
MPISRTEIPAEDAAALVEQLCKHWSAKRAVEREGSDARVVFGEGSCHLRAESDRLIVAVEALDDESHDRLEGEVHAALEALKGVSPDIVWET